MRFGAEYVEGPRQKTVRYSCRVLKRESDIIIQSNLCYVQAEVSQDKGK